jgi:TRAP-type C4-dicarboxylate transport system permease small subunit
VSTPMDDLQHHLEGQEEDVPAPFRTISRAVGLLAGGGIVILMLLTVADVVRRKIAGPGVPGTVEWTEVVLVIVVFAGMMPAELTRAHIRTSVLTDRVGRRQAALANGVAMLVVSAVVLWASYQTFETGRASFELREYRFGLVRVPVWPAKLIIPAALLLFGVVLGWRAVRQLRLALRGDSRQGG